MKTFFRPFVVVLLAISFANVCGQSLRQPIAFFPKMEAAAEQPVLLDNLSIRIYVIGNLAITSYDMSFYNPNNRVLEGNFTFPLSEGESVVGYDLDIEGKLRQGVVVDKAKGRQVFEEIVNRRVDPGIIEKTVGNNYRTRIYPIPASGFKRLVITTQQTLSMGDEGYLYVLPMQSGDVLTKFSLHVEVFNGAAKPKISTSPITNFSFEQIENKYVAKFEAQDFVLSSSLIFAVPSTDNPSKTPCFMEDSYGEQWFYSLLPTGFDNQQVKSEKLKKISLWWDVSLSAAKRNIEKEMEFLEQYLNSLDNLEVEITTFSNEIHEIKTFNYEKSRFDEIKNYLQSLIYDGATDLSIFKTTGKTNKVLLFSDGKNSLAEQVSPIKGAPVYAVISGINNDYNALSILSNHNTINLNKATVQDAAKIVSENNLRLINIECISGKVTDLYPKTGAIIGKDISICGKLLSEKAILTLSFGFSDSVLFTKQIEIDNRTALQIGKLDAKLSNVVSRLWGQHKIAELMTNVKKNKEEIIDLAVMYSIVTDYTSLIVLETIEDYIQYDISPPEELKTTAYYERLKNRPQRNNVPPETVEEIITNDVKRYYSPLIAWWKTTYPDTSKPVKISNNVPNTEENEVVEDDDFVEDDDEDFEEIELDIFDDDGGPTRVRVRRDAENLEVMEYAVTVEDFTIEMESTVSIQIYAEDAVFLEDAADDSFKFSLSKAKRSENTAVNQSVNTISLSPWTPNVPYLGRLQAAEDTQLYTTYLSLREEYINSPAFFVDAADVLFKRGMKPFAKRVLSNIIEITEEDAEMVKNYGQKLLEYELYNEALPVFGYGISLREEFPQSYRDYALACGYAGKYQEAFDIFHQILTTRWRRFDEIKPIVFAELNELINLHGKKINTGKTDKRLVFDMPVRVRIVISWSTDNCDIDLHVKEPNKEECFYGHSLTRQGGKMSQDFTAGFGPEAYMIKKNLKGEYEISVNYYGSRSQSMLMPVTVYADIFTNYGTSEQQRQRITFRLSDKKERVVIGKIKVE